ncbi:unnamed protein product [Ectocarpus sp. 12 AP-2014]
MARKELPQALTLEKFAAGKDGRSNAFKKKKQAKKRKLFEKAQLKRQYAKLLKKEAATARGEHGPEAPQSDGAAGVGKGKCADGLVLTPNRKWKEEGGGGELKQRRELSDDRESGERQHVIEGRKQEQRKPGKGRRPEHRPDPFKAAKATADQRRQEADEKQRKREMTVAERESRAKKRRKQHALLSKRTRGGQPVMRNTMQHLLEKIQSQR